MAKSVVTQLTHLSVSNNEDIQSSIFFSYIVIIELLKKKKNHMNDCCPRAMQLT